MAARAPYAWLIGALLHATVGSALASPRWPRGRLTPGALLHATVGSLWRRRVVADDDTATETRLRAKQTRPLAASRHNNNKCGEIVRIIWLDTVSDTLLFCFEAPVSSVAGLFVACQ